MKKQQAKRGPGRPKTGKAPRLNKVQVMLNDAELSKISKAANGNNSAFLREAGLSAADCS